MFDDSAKQFPFCVMSLPSLCDVTNLNVWPTNSIVWHDWHHKRVMPMWQSQLLSDVTNVWWQHYTIFVLGYFTNAWWHYHTIICLYLKNVFFFSNDVVSWLQWYCHTVIKHCVIIEHGYVCLGFYVPFQVLYSYRDVKITGDGFQFFHQYSGIMIIEQ